MAKDYGLLLKAEVKRITAALKKLGADKVILFGSLARGREDLFTDIDLIVVMESELPFVERCVWVYREVVPRVAADILVYTPAEFEEMKERPFLRHALREGVVLYAKGSRRRRAPVAGTGKD